jgi:RNA polymerase sigma factor (sigma-70 family)
VGKSKESGGNEHALFQHKLNKAEILMGNYKMYKDRFTDVFQYYRDEQSHVVPQARILELRVVMTKMIRSERPGSSNAEVMEILNEAFLVTIRDVKDGKISRDILGGAYLRIRRAVAIFNKANTVPKQHVLTAEFNQTKHSGIMKSAEHLVEQNEIIDEVNKALAQLSDRDRTIIYRHIVKEESLIDIAAYLDMEVKNIYTAHARAKARLRKLLQTEWDMYKETKDRDYIIAAPKGKLKD